ncbi:MAG: AEC family transporter [Burkholderiales bacterium]
MLAIAQVTLPFFALILCGYLAARARLLPPNAVPALNTFVLYFALPCMLLRFAARTPFDELFNPPVFLAYLTAGLLTLLAFAGIARRVIGEPMREAAFDGLAAAWSNWGYMGFALIPALLGARALPVVIAAGMADLLVVASAALALASLDARAGARRMLAAAAARVAANPLVWAIAAGSLLSLAEAPLPFTLEQFTRLLGEAAVPVALFTLGVSLYRPGTRIEGAEVAMIAVAKLVVHPYLALLVAAYVFRLEPIEVRTLGLMAALPVAGTVYLFAERGGANAERIAAAVLVTTALAFLSFAALAWAFGVSLAR